MTPFFLEGSKFVAPSLEEGGLKLKEANFDYAILSM